MGTMIDLAALSRYPDVQDPTLQAHDATDQLLVTGAVEAAAEFTSQGVPLGPGDVVVVGDRYGAITLSLLAAGFQRPRVLQDRLVHERALAANASRLGIDANGYDQVPTSLESFAHARLILWQLPRSVDAVRRMVSLMSSVSPDALLIAGGRIKHLSRGMNTPLQAGFGPVIPQLAQRKSRLLYVRRNASLIPAAVVPAKRDVQVAGHRLSLVGIGDAFGGAALDPGTRLMLDSLVASGIHLPTAGTVIDLGCGNGTVAAWASQQWPTATVIATDDSADAVASAEATLNATLDVNAAVQPQSSVGPEVQRARVVRADAGDCIPEASADLVLLNPPFHQGGTVHTGIGVKLIEAAARILKPGGRLVTVFNTPVGHRPRLQRIVGPTKQLARDRTFTVTLSARR